MNNLNNNSTKEAVFPTNDFVFKRIFGRIENSISTKSLIESITNENIKSIDLDKNTILEKDIMSDKLGILDVRAILNNNTEVDIEIQVVNQKNIEKRLLFYWSKMYIKTIEKGEEYEKLRRTIVIMIADFEFKNLKDIPKYHTKWKILETEYSKKVLTDDFEIDILELLKVKKYDKEKNKNKSLLLWTKFFTNPEELEEKEMEENEGVKKAKEELDEISQSEHEAYLAELRLKYIRDKNAEMAFAKDEGYELGIEEGKKQGFVQGKKNTQIEIAKKLLQENIDLKIIISITGLSEDEIKSLK